MDEEMLEEGLEQIVEEYNLPKMRRTGYPGSIPGRRNSSKGMTAWRP